MDDLSSGKLAKLYPGLRFWIFLFVSLFGGAVTCHADLSDTEVADFSVRLKSDSTQVRLTALRELKTRSLGENALNLFSGSLFSTRESNPEVLDGYLDALSSVRVKSPSLARFALKLEDRASRLGSNQLKKLMPPIYQNLIDLGSAPESPCLICTFLAETLNNPHDFYAWAKAQSDETMIKVASKLFDSDNSYSSSQERILQEIARLPHGGGPLFEKALQSSIQSVRIKAVEELGHFAGDENVLLTLLDMAAHDPYADTRTYALNAILTHRSKFSQEGFNTLVDELSNDPEPRVAERAREIAQEAGLVTPSSKTYLLTSHTEQLIRSILAIRRSPESLHNAIVYLKNRTGPGVIAVSQKVFETVSTEYPLDSQALELLVSSISHLGGEALGLQNQIFNKNDIPRTLRFEIIRSIAKSGVASFRLFDQIARTDLELAIEAVCYFVDTADWQRPNLRS